VLQRVSDGDHDTYELRHLNFSFGTDAVLSAYNALMTFKSDEFHAVVGDIVQNECVGLFEELIPNVIPASNALRHHHDRMFGRVRKHKFDKPEQYIGQLGVAIRLTDENLDVFVFEFKSENILRLIGRLSNLIGPPDAR